jgi:hypothetical protein
MPSFVPRSEPLRKSEQLAQRRFELHEALRKNLSIEKLIKVAEKYRTAQLLFLKARIHVIREKDFRNKSQNDRSEKLEVEMEHWNKKTVEEIIDEIKKDK